MEVDAYKLVFSDQKKSGPSLPVIQGNCKYWLFLLIKWMPFISGTTQSTFLQLTHLITTHLKPEQSKSERLNGSRIHTDAKWKILTQIPHRHQHSTLLFCVPVLTVWPVFFPSLHGRFLTLELVYLLLCSPVSHLPATSSENIGPLVKRPQLGRCNQCRDIVILCNI